MAVGFDATSTINTGTASFSSSTQITVGSSATLLLFFIIIQGSAPVSPTVTWNGVSMTQIGSTLTISGGSVTCYDLAWGLVNPTPGEQTLDCNMGVNPGCYILTVSFTGTSTASVAAATSGYNSATGNSTTMSVATGASVPTNGGAIVWGCDAGSGFSSSTPTFFTGGTTLGENGTDTANAAAAYVIPGSGSAMTASTGLQATDVWGAQALVLLAPSTSIPGGTLPLMGVGYSRRFEERARRIRWQPPRRRFMTCRGSLLIPASKGVFKPASIIMPSTRSLASPPQRRVIKFA